MNPDVAGLPSKRLSAMGWANAVGTNIDMEARAKSMKFEVVPESIRVRMVSGIPRIRVETKKDVSDREVRAVERGVEYTGRVVCRFAMRPKVHTGVFGSLVSFPRVRGCRWRLPRWRLLWGAPQRL